MSHKAFYQTFFQTEQLFRRADDALDFPAVASAVANTLVPEADAVPANVPDSSVELVDRVPTITIGDPVLPVASDVAPAQLPEQPPLVNTATPPVPIQPIAPVEMVTDPTSRQPDVRRPATPLISQKVLIMVDEDLLPSDLLFLEKILKAVHLDIDGVDLLNVHGTKNINFAELLAGKYIHHFFTFGVPFSRLNLDILMDRYHPVRFEGITFLMADSLPTIEADVALKKKLWESLKKVFLWR